MRGVDHADAALDRRRDIDAIREAIALELTDELQAWPGLEHRGVDHGCAMAHDQGVEAVADACAQSLGVRRVFRRSTPQVAPRGLALGGQPLPLGEPLQALEPLADQVALAHDRVATHQHARPRVHTDARSAGLTWLANSDRPSSDGKSRNHSMKCEMPSDW